MALSHADILALYEDNIQCAEIAGLIYCSDTASGITRKRQGKGWRFLDDTGKAVTDEAIKQRIAQLAIPPAWQQVWINPSESGHILATGVDDKGRKQYIYHPKWRGVRDLLNFYRLLSFGSYLPLIRKEVEAQLKKSTLDDTQVMAMMVWLLDNAYIRIGNETYFEENETVGLATLGREHLRIGKSGSFHLSFTGKSSQEQEIDLHDERMAELLTKLLRRPGERIFTREDGSPYTATPCNEYLRSLTHGEVSAKTFRTWGGTLATYEHLRANRSTEEKPEKVIIEAVDKSAEQLGNTRAVARSHYVHPHVLEIYLQGSFEDYYEQVKDTRKHGLTKAEAELLKLLELLFKKEFTLLQKK